jgi:hypothetical protein
MRESADANERSYVNVTAAGSSEEQRIASSEGLHQAPYENVGQTDVQYHGLSTTPYESLQTDTYVNGAFVGSTNMYEKLRVAASNTAHTEFTYH